jgi:hypothetical protein
MTPASDPTPAIEPATPPPMGTPRASREVAREVAYELAISMGCQLDIILVALTNPYPSDHIARAAWRDMRKIGAAMAKAMEALGPQAGPDGAVVPTPAPSRLQ